MGRPTISSGAPLARILANCPTTPGASVHGYFRHSDDIRAFEVRAGGIRRTATVRFPDGPTSAASTAERRSCWGAQAATQRCSCASVSAMERSVGLSSSEPHSLTCQPSARISNCSIPYSRRNSRPRPGAITTQRGRSSQPGRPDTQRAWSTAPEVGAWRVGTTMTPPSGSWMTRTLAP